MHRNSVFPDAIARKQEKRTLYVNFMSRVLGLGSHEWLLTTLFVECSCCGSDPTLEETPMKSITRLVTAVVAVMFAVAILCPAQDVKPTDLGKGAAFNGKKIEMKDKGEVAYLLSFTAGKGVYVHKGRVEENDSHLFLFQ